MIEVEYCLFPVRVPRLRSRREMDRLRAISVAASQQQRMRLSLVPLRTLHTYTSMYMYTYICLCISLCLSLSLVSSLIFLAHLMCLREIDVKVSDQCVNVVVAYGGQSERLLEVQVLLLHRP